MSLNARSASGFSSRTPKGVQVSFLCVPRSVPVSSELNNLTLALPSPLQGPKPSTPLGSTQRAFLEHPYRFRIHRHWEWVPTISQLQLSEEKITTQKQRKAWKISAAVAKPKSRWMFSPSKSNQCSCLLPVAHEKDILLPESPVVWCLWQQGVWSPSQRI